MVGSCVLLVFICGWVGAYLTIWEEKTCICSDLVDPLLPVACSFLPLLSEHQEVDTLLQIVQTRINKFSFQCLMRDNEKTVV